MSLGRSFLVSVVVALSAILLTVMTPGGASAGFVVTVTEVGSDLLFEYSGDFTGLATRTSSDTDPSFYGYRQDVFRALNTVGDPDPTRGGFSIFEGSYSDGPADFFPAADAVTTVSTTTAAPGSGTVVFNNVNGRFQSSSSFVSGDYSTSGAFTIPGKSYVDLGLPQNSSNTWNWTQTGQSFVPGNTLTIVTVPEPQALALVGTAGAAIATGFLRKRRISAED